MSSNLHSWAINFPIKMEPFSLARPHLLKTSLMALAIETSLTLLKGITSGNLLANAGKEVFVILPLYVGKGPRCQIQFA